MEIPPPSTEPISTSQRVERPEEFPLGDWLSQFGVFSSQSQRREAALRGFTGVELLDEDELDLDPEDDPEESPEEGPEASQSDATEAQAPYNGPQDIYEIIETNQPYGVREHPNGAALRGRFNLLIRSSGYGLAIKSSDPKSKSMKSCYFACDRHGEPRNTRKLRDKERKRQVRSRKIGCPFEFVARHRRHQDRWELELINGNHNHPPTETEEAHTVHRRKALTKEVTECLETMLDNGASMTSIHLTLQKEGRLTKKDIHNIANDLFRKRLAGKSPMRALLELLQEPDSDGITMISDYKINPQNNRLTHLFFAHPTSIEILQKNHDVMLLDCTYKTNKFKLPMLNIVFVTGVHTTINLGFCFMNSEKEVDYR